MDQNQNPEVYIDEASTRALQLWLWECSRRGWHFESFNDQIRWTHEDNMLAASMGWILAQPPNSTEGILELYSLRPSEKPAVVLENIKQMRYVHPICSKALIAMAQMKIRFPHVQFSYQHAV